jgi:hypothetical protein
MNAVKATLGGLAVAALLLGVTSARADETAELEATIRKALIGSYVHSALPGVASVSPLSGDPKRVVLQDEAGRKGVFRLEDFNLIPEGGQMCQIRARILILPDRVVLSWQSAQDHSWISPRK